MKTKATKKSAKPHLIPFQTSTFLQCYKTQSFQAEIKLLCTLSLIYNINLGVYCLRTFTYINTLQHRKQPNITVHQFLTAKTQVGTSQIKATDTPQNHCSNSVHLTSNSFKMELGGSQTTPYFAEWVRYRKPSKMDLPQLKFCGCISQEQHQLLLSCALPRVQALETFPKVSPHCSNYTHSVSPRAEK